MLCVPWGRLQGLIDRAADKAEGGHVRGWRKPRVARARRRAVCPPPCQMPRSQGEPPPRPPALLQRVLPLPAPYARHFPIFRKVLVGTSKKRWRRRLTAYRQGCRLWVLSTVSFSHRLPWHSLGRSPVALRDMLSPLVFPPNPQPLVARVSDTYSGSLPAIGLRQAPTGFPRDVRVTRIPLLLWHGYTLGGGVVRPWTCRDFCDLCDAVELVGDRHTPWPSARKQALQQEACCRLCGNSSSLVVHHICGRRSGHGRMNLAVLCRSCHAGVGLAPHAWVWWLVASHPA